MTLLGIDFDNTIVKYDRLFHKIAYERGLIKESLPANKIVIRDYLRNHKKDHLFTFLQGEVYGLRILEAEPAEGVIEKLRELRNKDIAMVIVSHKTKWPYAGPKYNLQQAATDWLEKYEFFDKEGLGWNKKDVYLEESKENKIRRIKKLGCTHYIDDLPEVLNNLPEEITRIQYDTSGKRWRDDIAVLNRWEDLEI